MKTNIITTVIMALTCSMAIAFGADHSSKPHSSEQIYEYRSAGIDGVFQFVFDYHALLNSDDPLVSKEWHRTLDQISGQKDSYYSRLFWLSDLDEAKLEAKIQNKPILYLRMLGKLTEDLSCANSRMFRTLLYTDERVQEIMREEYVLCWGSERPVPQVTIDFGDGRQIKTTITGNSIHYILDTLGQPIDGIPGMNSPEYFSDQLQQAKNLFLEMESLEGSMKSDLIQKYHEEQAEQIAMWGMSSWIQVGMAPAPVEEIGLVLPEFRTTSKGLYELPILALLDPWTYEMNLPMLNQERWIALARNDKRIPSFGRNALDLIKLKNPGKYRNAEKWTILLDNVSSNVGIETVRNIASMKYVLHTWFADPAQDKDLEVFNERVYSELFATPASDPWLGFMSSEAYSALDNDGIRRSGMDLDIED